MSDTAPRVGLTANKTMSVNGRLNEHRRLGSMSVDGQGGSLDVKNKTKVLYFKKQRV